MSKSPRLQRLRAGLLTTVLLAWGSALGAAPVKPAKAPPAPKRCFLLMNLETREVTRSDEALCATRLPPASTFKVPHALIALETGVVAHVDDVHTWDGTKRGVEAWNQDQTLDTAMRRSALWVFQGTAKKIGRARMEAWLKRFHYGTEDASGDITLFWLGGPLRISPEEQLDFLARFYRDELPVRPEVSAAVKAMLVHGPDTVASVRAGINQGGPWKDGAVLSAKTGWYTHKTGDVTWLVGHVSSPKGRHIFVSAVQSPPGESPAQPPALVAAIDALKGHGLL
ncbi:hypothetical protein LZ198_25400 [Myxococcus sp. K15C18031901]|uniref:penicillin-binding transpeptidase domain-containing protein n=1 Tax=Myxococcus dinghuensis TaxID=2906761 RepID=UPI0020A78D4E|nr:penicillin-binding transpeptidase domain-containing protein [Myxococcus dinghuensis]MCP3102210.1 hypothetical protein [Myxococcus dinghuensis]